VFARFVHHNIERAILLKNLKIWPDENNVAGSVLKKSD